MVYKICKVCILNQAVVPRALPIRAELPEGAGPYKYVPVLTMLRRRKQIC